MYAIRFLEYYEDFFKTRRQQDPYTTVMESLVSPVTDHFVKEDGTPEQTDSSSAQSQKILWEDGYWIYADGSLG
jgi:hypothetical protein